MREIVYTIVYTICATVSLSTSVTWHIKMVTSCSGRCRRSSVCCCACGCGHLVSVGMVTACPAPFNADVLMSRFPRAGNDHWRILPSRFACCGSSHTYTVRHLADTSGTSLSVTLCALSQSNGRALQPVRRNHDCVLSSPTFKHYWHSPTAVATSSLLRKLPIWGNE